MSISGPARVLLLNVPVILALAACQNRSIGGPNVGDTSPEIGGFPQAVEPLDGCTGEELEDFDLCGPGECTPEGYVPWSEGSPGAPEFTWTMPCNPDGYKVQLRPTVAETLLADESLTPFDPAINGPRRSWHPDVDLEPATTYVYWIQAYLTEGATNSSPVLFWTGPLCEGVPTEAPTLDRPKDGWVWSVTEAQASSPGMGITFRWYYPKASCLVNFDVEMATDAAFTHNVIAVPVTDPDEHVAVFVGEMMLCRTYYWHVRAHAEAGPGPWSPTWSFFLEANQGDGMEHSCFDIRPIEAVAREDLACRLGPSTNFGILTYVPAGEAHPVGGLSAARTHVWLSDILCYVPRERVEFESDPPFPPGSDVGDLLSILPDPATPTVPVTACAPTMNQPDCLATGGTWVPGSLGTVPIPGHCDCP